MRKKSTCQLRKENKTTRQKIEDYAKGIFPFTHKPSKFFLKDEEG